MRINVQFLGMTSYTLERSIRIVRFDPTQSDANKNVWNKGCEILYVSQQNTEYY